ncbi:MAG: acyl-CoA thioesterase [Ignavibacteriae bacterium]|nr:acyl-CoA thioesterase [Ignavibacteria bacterium]MBI3364697.1 acyl-CoA thioesterase [Ignavibacteriota bacterium]
MSISAETKIRVRYADTDQMKMVYYGKFFEYFEQGRSDLLRDIGMPYPEIERMGYYLPVIEAHARYLKAARYDDLLIVKTIVNDAPQARIRIEYKVHHDETNELLAEGHTVHSFVNAATGRPTRAPEQFLETLSEAVSRAAAAKSQP